MNTGIYFCRYFFDILNKTKQECYLVNKNIQNYRNNLKLFLNISIKYCRKKYAENHLPDFVHFVVSCIQN